MSTYETTGLMLPDGDSISMGGGPSILTIRMTDNFSAVYTDALWNIIPLLAKVDVNRAAAGGAENQNIVLMQNKTLTIQNPNAGNDDATLEIPIDTYLDTVEIGEFLDTRKGWKEFILIPQRIGAAYKMVFFACGHWKQDTSRSSSGNAVNQNQLTFVVEKHGQASGGITFPALPANTDVACDGSAEANEYLGWIFAAADADIGGLGAAVTMVTITDLPGTKLGVRKKYTT